MYRHAYDVYSLGILLLEVGLWKKLRIPEEPDAETQEDHYELRRWIRREYLDTLRWACGNTYADVVLSCIMIDCSDDEAGMASERESFVRNLLLIWRAAGLDLELSGFSFSAL
jgi:predicted alpha/beta hydrolase